MKKIILAIILAVASIGTMQAQQNQTDSVVYIIGTSFESECPATGFIRSMSGMEEPYLYLGPVYHFIICSLEKDCEIWFIHVNYNLTELAKIRRVFPGDSMETQIRPRSELATYANVVDVDELIYTKTREEIWKWARLIAKKKIYIIDRNDFFSENGVEKMKLIEVGVTTTNEPEPDDH